MKTLQEVKDLVLLCAKCNLYKTKKKYVFGDGNEKAKIMFIGEAPGEQENLQGKPFVGRAGQVFEELLISIGKKRDEIYICNILKCRPSKDGNNRPPEQDEIDKCIP
jgi:DNA polymerase